MRKTLRDNSLSLAMFGLFVLFLVGHSVAGYYDYNDDQHAHQQSLLSYTAYLTSGHFWATVFENWESEFLQMAAYVVFTVFLFQRGSAESKDPDAVGRGGRGPPPPSTPSAGPGTGAPGRARADAVCPFPVHGLSSSCSSCPFSGMRPAARHITTMSNAHTAKRPSPCASTWAPRAFGSSPSRIGRANS